MARNERLINAGTSAVYALLADPRSYAYWVLGSREIRDADADWPRAGSRLHHTVGAGPLRIKDETVVEGVHEGSYLRLKAKARPLGTAVVSLTLAPVGTATRVTMVEEAGGPLSALLFAPSQPLLRRRNARALERLADLAEGRTPMPRAGGDSSAAAVNPLRRRRRRRMLVGAVAALAVTAACAMAAQLLLRRR